MRHWKVKSYKQHYAHKYNNLDERVELIPQTTKVHIKRTNSNRPISKEIEYTGKDFPKKWKLQANCFRQEMPGNVRKCLKNI